MPASTRTDPLAKYNQKRDFRRTKEPKGKRGARRKRLSYVVQKHAASRLHYDFRLELDGVLKSWAVPKGPSLDPSDRLLAVATEDHPVDYADFEGVIPKGEYGGGTVELWDRGTWDPIGDPRDGLARGKLEFVVHGEKLEGRFVFVKLRDTDKDWLLLKAKDRDAESHGAPLPDFVPSQLATLVSEPPAGPGWLHEIKLDGYRVQCRRDGDDVRWTSRNGNEWTKQLEHLSEAVRALPGERLLLDGEIVHIDEHGRTSFQRVANAIGGKGARELVFHAFDPLHADGRDLAKEPLLSRKEALRELCRAAPAEIRFTDHVKGRGDEFLREACKLRLEGIVSKRADAPYRPGRGRDWLKIKCLQRQEFVVVGWTPPTHSGDRLGSLVLGVHDDGELVYAGRVGTGFGRSDRAALRERLDALATDRMPLAKRPRAPGLGAVRWVEPELVAEVAFTEWTNDGRLRHPTFRGLREDKGARAVVRERPAAPTKTRSRKPHGDDASVAGVAISNPEKVLYPDVGVTKIEIARYYESVAHFMLPHLRDRPLMLRRCPDGPDKPCFYQKHAGNAVPAGIRTFEIEEDDGERGIYLAVDDLEGLLGTVQLGALELHVWGSRRDKVDNPDRMVLDLDPDPSVSFADVKTAALELRERLDALGLESFVMTTGGKGLHVVVPLVRAHGFDEVKAFSRAIAEHMVADAPRRFVAQATKSKRAGRIFVDYLRNGRGATAIAPYSTRARANASVAVPLAWDELDGLDRGDAFDLGRVHDRLARRRKDVWADYDAVKQRLSAAAQRDLGVR